MTFTVGGDVASQQNGNIWASENAIVSLSLNGTLNVFDPRDNSIWRRIHARISAAFLKVNADIGSVIGTYKSCYSLNTGLETGAHIFHRFL